MEMKSEKTPGIGKEKVKLTPKNLLNKVIPPEEKETYVRPKGTKSFHVLPEDRKIGTELARVEKLINQRHFGQALKSLEELTAPESPFKEHYQARIAEKRSELYAGSQ